VDGNVKQWEVGHLEAENFKEAMARAGELLERGVPLKRHEHNVYSKIVRLAFEDVQKARADGFSFTQICGAFEGVELLPQKAHPHSFRQAFYREKKRQEKEKKLLKRIKNGAHVEEKRSPMPAKMEETSPDKAEVKEKESVETTEEELMRKVATPTKKTGFGKLTKNVDGSFDFD
jgi:hypothetical protein